MNPIEQLRQHATRETEEWMADPRNQHSPDRKPQDHIAWKAAQTLEDQMNLGTVLSALYRSEINVSVTCFWDDGWQVKIGDEMNGFKAEKNFQNDKIGHIGEWLTRKAKELYPQSTFAKAA